MATWCAKWRIKLNPEKTKVIIFSRSLLARKVELNLTLYGETLKIYPRVKFLGITFDSKLTFQLHFEDILERCNNRYHRLRLLANKKWGPSPATLIQIYKQCVRPIFEYGSLSTITASDHIISKIQRLQNKFIRLALRLPKYTYLRNKRMRRCGVAPPPIIFERLQLPQQIIYRRKENLSESPNHQKYWENILVSRFYEQFSRNRRNLGHFRKFEKISNS